MHVQHIFGNKYKMAIEKNYVVWNNKGGVGKSTITYHLATRYAELHQDEDVLVIDMCPQANVSMMLLGGGTNGESNVLSLCTLQRPQTVVGYITEVISQGQGAAIPSPSSFYTQVNQFNNKLPSNLYLLCGDGNLEPISPAIVNYANMPPIAVGNQPWVWIHNIIKDYINSFSTERENQGRNIAVFIDTNPAFGVYTELAIVAGDKIICPVNADDSSRIATNAMTILLHGSNPPHPIYGSWTFAAKAQQYAIKVPLIHLIVGNRFTQYDGAAAAYRAMSDATAEQLYNIYINHSTYFTRSTRPVKNVNEFRDEYSVYLRDFNSSGVVAAHEGDLLSHIHSGIHRVHHEDVNLDNRRLSECLQAVDDVLGKL